MHKFIVSDDNADFQEEQWEESDSVAFVASASEDGDIVMWDAKSKEILQRIEKAHQGVCFWVDVHGETGTMVSCGKDGRVVVFRHRFPESRDEKRRPPVNGHVKSEEFVNGETYSKEEGRAGDKADETLDEPEAEETKSALTNGVGPSSLVVETGEDEATTGN